MTIPAIRKRINYPCLVKLLLIWRDVVTAKSD